MLDLKLLSSVNVESDTSCCYVKWGYQYEKREKYQQNLYNRLNIESVSDDLTKTLYEPILAQKIFIK